MGISGFNFHNMKKFLISKYYIPNYQREYAWEKEELDDFWNDLMSCMDENRQHFFGQIVVHKYEKEDTIKLYIIDGQQRVTTSMIFLKVLQKKAMELYSITNDAYLLNGIVNDIGTLIGFESDTIYGRNSENLGYHLTLGEADSAFFKKVILEDKEIDNNIKFKKSQQRLFYAYKYFNDKIDEYLKDGNTDKIGKIDKIYNTFINKFNVMYMESTDLEEAFTIFETLNARGRDLETSDLLKNLIFRQYNDNINDAKAMWDQILANLDQTDLTKYIRHFWNSRYSFSREKELYRKISYTIDSPKKSKDLIENLVKYSKYYHAMDLPDDDNKAFENDEINKCLKILKILKASTFYPVIISMLDSDKYKEKDIAEVVKIIEIYVFRNFTICKNTANKTEIFFANLAKKIYDEEILSKDEIIREIKNEIVSDDIFKTTFMDWIAPKSSKEVIRYVLKKIHNYYSKTTEINIDNTEVHIEHIMPENNSKWNVDDEIHESYLWRLGNLALLDGKLNIANSNRVFEEKRESFKISKIEPNREIVEKIDEKTGNVIEIHEWNEQEIIERQRKFSEVALNIWSNK